MHPTKQITLQTIIMKASGGPALGLTVPGSLTCCWARRLLPLLLLSISDALKAFSFHVITVQRHSCSKFHHHRSVGIYRPTSFVKAAAASGEGGQQQQQSSSEMLLDMFQDQFNRWRFLQELLEGDASPDLANQLVYEVLDGALKYPRYDAGAEIIVLPPDERDRIQSLVENFTRNGRIPVMTSRIDTDDNSEDKESAVAILRQLENLLPTAEQDEEAVKSSWDTVIEIHGRETVKYNESKNPTVAWKFACVVVRVLLHFDFLTLGIVKSPLLK
jgi:hypothetical protein